MKTTPVFWQPALQAPGEIVRGPEDIRQSIQIILRTP
ncbi:TPA: baseplate protein, partial [Proteus mirabilis]|nr:baseplate protein [Proteus mirabilis]